MGKTKWDGGSLDGFRSALIFKLCKYNITFKAVPLKVKLVKFIWGVFLTIFI